MRISMMNGLITAEGEPREMAEYCSVFVTLLKTIQEQMDSDALAEEMERIRKQYGDDFADGMKNG